MNEAIKQADEVCRPATPQEEALFLWAEEMHRKSLSFVSDSLKQLVALTTALLGGTAALYNQIPTPQPFKATFFAFVLAALGVSVFGGFPLTASVLYTEDARSAWDRGMAFRSRCLWWAGLLLFAAFLVIGVGLLPALFGYTPPILPVPSMPPSSH